MDKIVLNEELALLENTKCLERAFPDGRIFYIHAMTFKDAQWIKKKANFYTSLIKGIYPDSNGKIKPDEEILKLTQVICVCRPRPNCTESIFEVPGMQEKEAFDILQRYIPQKMIDYIILESDNLSMENYIPVKKNKNVNVNETSDKLLIEILTDDEIIEHLNYFSYRIFGKPIYDVDNLTIGEAKNIIEREEDAAQKLVEAISIFMEALAK
jgi:acyl CoA:acetate/3-ketoacid CoA transferase